MPPLISKRHQRFSKRQFRSIYAGYIVSAENRIYQKDIAAQLMLPRTRNCHSGSGLVKDNSGFTKEFVVS